MAELKMSILGPKIGRKENKKKKIDRRQKNPQGKTIMVCHIP